MKKRISFSLLSGLIAGIAATNIYADDTELFTGSSSAASNVVFLFDTSGSMNDPGGFVSEPYDANTVYESDYNFNSDSFYVYRFGERPWPLEDEEFDLDDDQASRMLNNEVVTSQIRCTEAMETASGASGQYIGQMAYWGSDKNWSAPDNYAGELPGLLGGDFETEPSNASAMLECNNPPYSYQGNSYNYLRYPLRSDFPYTNSSIRSDSVFDDGGGFTHMFSGNYLNYYAVYGSDEAYELTRMEVLRRAAKEVIQSLPENVSVALMRFNLEEGGYVKVAMKPGRDNYEEFASALDSFEPTDWTPITEAMYESMLYLSEQPRQYGNNSVSDSLNGNTYTLPELSACNTTTKVVLFSDGLPAHDTSSNDDVVTLLGGVLSDPLGKVVFDCNAILPGISDGQCAEELAYYMNNEHGIVVDTIGGFTGAGSSGSEKLQSIADGGRGTFYPADNYEEIKNALLNSAVETLTNPGSYTSPAIAVSSYNTLEISDELYYAVFEPTPDFAWKGNLKRYAISNEGIVDAEDALAIDDSTGFFSESAKSFWSAEIDGNTVTSGGAAAQQEPAGRNIYTIHNGNLRSFDPSSANYIQDATLGLDLVSDSDVVNEDTGMSYRDVLLNWIAGYLVGNEGDLLPRLAIEDPLHSRPVVINYAEGEQVVYLGTNSGYLHAINTSDGTERFALLPEETLKNPNYYMSPSLIPEDRKLYALDGPLTYWHNDHNLNGAVDGSDTVYLYFGMRRGGHSYYALDVTDPDAPSMLWSKHGTYTDTDTKNAPGLSSGFGNLGQTWSSLMPALVKWQGSDKVVLFAGGGYDPDEDGTDLDGTATRVTADTGNTVYMLDASTGAVLWDAQSALSPADMTSSFPADVTPIDRNNNGYVDLLYAADVGGRVWRFDISEEATGSGDFAEGGVILDINTSSADGISGNRHFYTSPDVSYITNTTNPYVLVSIGSGNRAHPRTTATGDYQILLKDTHSTGVPGAGNYTTVTLDDLVDWSSPNADESVYGWYLGPGQNGEKALSSSVTLSGIVTFNTYLPEADETDQLQCTGSTGQSNIYQLALTDAALAQVNCDAGDICPMLPGESVEPVQTVAGLAPDPTITLPPADPDDAAATCEDSSLVILSGTATTNGHLNRCDLFSNDYWKENR